ncbi:uncharacterized protein LOC127277488 isoform X1 [Leptopilina boulardi]|uniref:uncharacterized protein LOC127277488 isoform X1 n=1 Tax=Leptopilina boulardi TaxID=63433 RepID=UPI0021F5242B|nr:uncharacterized protein LOC127277488 isoform X1 [Leptopilina boulardi]
MEANYNFLDIVQTVSIFNYLDTLSNILFKEKYLNQNDKLKSIPIVNAVFHYLDINQTQKIFDRKTYLIKEILKDSDLYGGKENEKIDENFVDAFFRQIIISLVFEKYTIYGFLAEIVRNNNNNNNNNNMTVNNLYEKIELTLLEIKIENSSTKLSSLTINKILNYIILPLLPKPKSDMHIMSLDYIYAQAGSVFLYSSEISKNNNSKDPNVEFNDLTKNNNSDDKFQEYIAIGNAIELLATAGKINETSLKIFALPAIFYYVYNEKTQSIENIINNSTLVTKAYKMLFTYLNKTFENVEKAQKNNHRYQFHLAMANFKNRTTLAREIIKRKCPLVRNLEYEVTKYKNNPDDYQCTGKENKTLEDVNRLYQKQVNNIVDKYFAYEMESIRKAFGSDFIKSVDDAKVKIFRGLVKNSYDGFSVYETQLVKEANDLFRFYFPGNETSLYYALLRENNNLNLIRETDYSDDPESSTSPKSTTPKNSTPESTTSKISTPKAPSILNPSGRPKISPIPKITETLNPDEFRQKLGLPKTQIFRNNFFPTLLKHEGENFEIFLTRIVREKTRKFNTSLSLENYDQTNKEWWKDFGLSLLPFYTCVHEFQTENFEIVEISCLLDAISLFPLITELRIFVTSITKSLLTMGGTTLKTLAKRMTIRQTLLKLGTILITQSTPKVLNFGLSVFRFLDPGFEFILTIGEGGLRSIGTLIKQLKSISFKSLEQMLMNGKEKILKLKKIATIDYKNIYIKSMSIDSGYDYKFTFLPDNQLVELRMVQEYKKEIPVIFDNKSKSYKAVNIFTGHIKNKNLHLEYSLEKRKLMEEEKKVENLNENFLDESKCESGRNKRSPNQCTKTELLKQKRIHEQNALKIALNTFNKEQVISELSKYFFPKPKIQEEFVTEWIKTKGPPIWSKKYQIEEIHLYNELKYKEILDTKITEEEARRKIEKLYPLGVINSHTKFSTPKYLAEQFNEKRLYKHMKFEDFYALRNYGGTGYRKMSLISDETNRIKNAIYRLAIRQSDDSFKNFETLLFRGETRLSTEIEEEFYHGRKEYQLSRFTSTSEDIDTAEMFTYIHDSKKSSILYEIYFPERYLRADIKEFTNLPEKETILLPGTKFRINSIKKNKNRHF